MIEQGLVILIQSNAAVQAIVAGGATGGGYFVDLPKNAPLPSWTYLTVFNSGLYGLQSQPGLVQWRVQIDCYSGGISEAPGDNGAGCINLSNAIYGVLSGYAGTLADPQSTKVDSIFLIDQHDFFDEIRRSWRRMTEFRVNYYFPIT